jgi:hypothetical protein
MKGSSSWVNNLETNIRKGIINNFCISLVGLNP